MISATVLLGVVIAYLVVVFGLSMRVERSARMLRLLRSPVVYSLSLAIYCTAWTFYGSVGKAVTSGPQYLAIHLGPTIAFIAGSGLIRKLVHIKNTHRITSIADFLSARYERSQGVAAVATMVALLALAPYLSLQLKAIIHSFSAVVAPSPEEQIPPNGSLIGPLTTALLIAGTIAVGVRRLDPTERHQGMVMTVALESLVKLVALTAVGMFVTFSLFDGVGDLAGSLDPGRLPPLVFENSETQVSWTTYLILAMSAIILLPRQFHVTVVECADEDHLRHARWMVPLYLLAINIFVLPIAMAGLALGLPAERADIYVLLIPLANGSPGLALLVFIGGLSAAASMITVCAVTMATMISNHLVLPVADLLPWLGAVRRHMLSCRWICVALVIGIGYVVEQLIGERLMLVNLGMLSFAGVAQFAPAALAGLLWRGGSRSGALGALVGGFGMCIYTLFLPAFARSGWAPMALVEHGPFGIGWLRPEQLLGLTVLDPFSHGVFWSLSVNVLCYLILSRLYPPSEAERRRADSFISRQVDRPISLPSDQDKRIALEGKCQSVTRVLEEYFDTATSERLLSEALKEQGLDRSGSARIEQLLELSQQLERSLAGSFGAAEAHRMMRRIRLLDQEEKKQLSMLYAKVVAEMDLPPVELMRRIDFHRERAELMERHSEELERTVHDRTLQLEATNRELESFVYSVSHDLRAPLRSLSGFSKLLADQHGEILDDNAAEYLTRIDSASRRMSDIIDSLLRLSRTSRRAMQRREVDLSSMAEEIRSELESAHPDRTVVWIITPRLRAQADPHLSRIVLQNLLDNAWKYTSLRRESAEIELGALADSSAFFVRDNGVGFDMAYAEKLFGAFQRLHSRREFEGMGIGLATVARIVRRHGGEVWAEAKVDQGATFFFTFEESAPTAGEREPKQMQHSIE